MTTKSKSVSVTTGYKHMKDIETDTSHSIYKNVLNHRGNRLPQELQILTTRIFFYKRPCRVRKHSEIRMMFIF